MSVFDWQTEYEIDHNLIDEQHHKLLKIAETLFNAVIAQENETHLKTCFDELFAYTQKHFSDEEALFKEMGSTDLDAHINEHSALAEELQDVWQKELMGFQEEKGRTLLNWVEERLLPHMMLDDQKTYQSRPQS